MEISESLKDVITNLLETAPNRFGYSELVKHKFFLHVDWNNLESGEFFYLKISKCMIDQYYQCSVEVIFLWRKTKLKNHNVNVYFHIHVLQYYTHLMLNFAALDFWCWIKDAENTESNRSLLQVTQILISRLLKGLLGHFSVVLPSSLRLVTIKTTPEQLVVSPQIKVISL